MKFSIIVPVYNRPDEVAELLESLLAQTVQTFEVILVDDGSSVNCQTVAETYANKFSLSYYYIPNGGPGQARNYGAARSSGEYLIVLDSDCILPPCYIESLVDELNQTNADAFGGPDRASKNFTKPSIIQ